MPPDFRSAVERSQALLWEAEGNLDALAAWAAAHPLDPAPAFSFRSEIRHVLLARAWLALGRRGEAATLLERLDQSAQTGGRDGSRIEILALLAAARAETPVTALEALDAALRLAAPEGWLHVFLDVGGPLRELVTVWLRRSRAPEDEPIRAHAGRLLAAFDGEQPPAAAAPETVLPGLAEQLSSRELEVLRLVAGGLTNQQIAARLVISIRTVKKHIENINGKLAAQNRTQAVARARELGLLST